MGLLGNMLGKILPASKWASQPSIPEAAGATATPAQPPPAAEDVDIDVVLSGLEQAKRQRLDWRHSIVDLMKLLDMDSSLEARRELAKELHYDGDWSDTAAMNIWLHKQVMQKVAASGGKVPSELLH